MISWRLKAVSQTHLRRGDAGDSVYVELERSTGGNRHAVDWVVEHNPELMAHFCPGTPVYFTSNISPLRGIANGSKGFQ